MRVAFDKEVNPFHATFSLDKVLAVIKDLESNSDVANQLSLVFFIRLSSPRYKEFYETLQLTLKKKNLAQDYFLYSLSLSNHETVVMSGRLQNRKPEGDVVNLLAFYDLKKKCGGLLRCRSPAIPITSSRNGI